MTGTACVPCMESDFRAGASESKPPFCFSPLRNCRMAALASVFSRSVNCFTSSLAARANLAGSVNIFVIICANTPEAVCPSMPACDSAEA